MRTDLKLLAKELSRKGKYFEKEKSIGVLGCSTSAVAGYYFGQLSSLDVAIEVVDNIAAGYNSESTWLGVQCCEHLNRCLVVPRVAADELRLKIVRAIPTLKAGGAAATYYWSVLDEPVLVEKVDATSAIDIGGTLVGMHIRDVAVPIQPSFYKEAILTGGYSRLPMIGGERTIYTA